MGMIAKEIKPGINTLFLDKIAEEYIRDHGGTPAFLGLYGFPNSICASINNTVVHAPPNQTIIKEGDILSIDCGVLMNHYYSDQAYTFEIGEVDNNIKNLLEKTKKALYFGIKHCVFNGFIGDIGFYIQKYIENNGFFVVKDLVGHGIGKNIHEEPHVPNYGKLGKGLKIKNGLVLAIEPMVNMKSSKVVFLNDGWTVITYDGMPSAHYEQNVAIMNNKTYLLSTYKYIYKALGVSSDEEDGFLKF